MSLWKILGLIGGLLGLLRAYAGGYTDERTPCCERAKNAMVFQFTQRTAIKLLRLTPAFSFLCTRVTSYLSRAPQGEDPALKN